MMYHLVNNYIVFEFMFLILIIIHIMFGLSCFVEYLTFDTTQTQSINILIKNYKILGE